MKVSKPPELGVYITGLQLHNAAWNEATSSLKEFNPSTRNITKMPIIWLKPIEKAVLEKDRQSSDALYYDCPIYTADTAAHLGTTGIVGSLELPSMCDPAVWTQCRTFLSTEI